MGEQSSCLYVAVLTERQLVQSTTTAPVLTAIEAWRAGIADLLAAVVGQRETRQLEALADHVFVTFEGAFILCRATGDPSHMRSQLAALRTLLMAWVNSLDDGRATTRASDR
jgi:TetR/AcrR family transcriptional repressor of nem operon